MEKLLKIAESKGCRAEVYSLREKSVSMSKVNGAVSDVSASIQYGVSLRIIKDRKLGFAYTKNLTSREQLVENALASMKAGVDADYDFPASGFVNFTEDYHAEVESMSFPEIRNTVERVEKLYGEMKQGVLETGAGCGTSETRIINTSGADLRQKDSSVYALGAMIYPGTSSGIRNIFYSNSSVSPFAADAERAVDFFNSSLPEIEVGDSRMKVIFAPDSMNALTWRLGMATSAKSFYEKISPLLNRKNQQIVSPRLSFISDPASDKTDRRLFDDEGVKTERLPVIENGIFKSVCNNLDYASKMGEKPAGTGFRRGMWGGDKISITPVPSLSHASFAYGDKSFQEMLSMIDRGVIIYGALGAHSGNILNGDLSIGLNPGLYVENGRVIGRVKDAMMAGNIYEMLSKAIAVENAAHYTDSIYTNPAILLDDISVVGS